MDELKFIPAGDNGIIIEVGKEINKETNKKIRALIYCLQNEKVNFAEIIEMIPTYTTIMLIYDPAIIMYKDLVAKLSKIEEKIEETILPPAKVIHVPVVYGGAYGPDLLNVAKHNQLKEKEIIQLHCSNQYLIYMLGFTPGFPYLGGMNEKIATPRLEKPRQTIPAGSVGIAGNQTGIYPIDSPGGWQLIGRTPLKLFDPERSPVVLFQAGDYIQFEPITEEEYTRIEGASRVGEYQVKESLMEGRVNHV